MSVSTRNRIAPKVAVRGVGIAAALGGVVAAGLVAAPGSADARPVAAIEDDRFVSAPVNTLPSRIQRMKSTRTKYTHVDIFWNEVVTGTPSRPGSNTYSRAVARNHTSPVYNWDRIDTIMNQLRLRNIIPILQVYSYPLFTNGGRQAPVNPLGGFRTQYIPWAPKPGQYADFVFALMKRYNGRQTVPLNGQNVRLPRARHIEHGNEVNLKSFFRKGRGTSTGAYVRMAVAGAKAANAAQRGIGPRVMNIGGTFGPRSSGGNGNIGALTFIKRLYRNKAFRANMQAVGGHVYPAAAPTKQVKGNVFPAWSNMNLWIQEKAKYGNLRNKPIFITEAGYTTASTPFRKTKVTRSQQATYYRQIINNVLPREERQAKQNMRRRGVNIKQTQFAMVIFFNKQDNAAWPGGLWTERLREKPSLRAFRGLANRPTPPNLRGVLRT
jgi:hypothetical protein